MSFETVSERLTVLQESNAQLKDLIERLRTIKFQPGSIPVDSDEDNVLSELTSEIQQTLKDQREDFELLQEEVLDLDSGGPGSELEKQRNGLLGSVERATRELKTCEGAFRKAQITARQNLIAAQKAERELLLKSYLEPRSSNSSPAPGQQRRHKPRPELSKEEKTVNASSDVTLTLRRTHDMMAAELSRSQFAHDTLKDSTAALAQLSETYSTLDTMLSSSKNLLGTLLRSQKSDTWYLETAFYVLLATIGWLIWRRILYGPTWWLLWFPMKMFIKGWMGVFAAMGLRGGLSSDIAVGSSSMHGRETVVHNSATRGPRPNMSGASAPTVSVGGGGKGTPMRGSRQPGQGSEERVSEQVGRIIDESQDDQTVPESLTGDVTEGEEAGTQKNSKKRMWEEDKEVAKEAERKDEL